jgi:hypothetical protein
MRPSFETRRFAPLLRTRTDFAKKIDARHKAGHDGAPHLIAV